MFALLAYAVNDYSLIPSVDQNVAIDRATYFLIKYMKGKGSDHSYFLQFFLIKMSNYEVTVYNLPKAVCSYLLKSPKLKSFLKNS